MTALNTLFAGAHEQARARAAAVQVAPETFTLVILIDGETQIETPGLSIDRLRRLLPTIESAIPALQQSGPVAVLVKNEFGITHILGSYR